MSGFNAAGAQAMKGFSSRKPFDIDAADLEVTMTPSKRGDRNLVASLDNMLIEDVLQSTAG